MTLEATAQAARDFWPLCSAPTCQPQDGFVCATHEAVSAALQAREGELETARELLADERAELAHAVEVENALRSQLDAARQARLAAQRQLDEIIAGLVSTLGPPSGKNWRESLAKLSEPHPEVAARVEIERLQRSLDAVTASHLERGEQLDAARRDSDRLSIMVSAGDEVTEDLRARLEILTTRCTAIKNANIGLEDKVVELREALRRYGRHFPSCPKWNTDGVCNCGWDEAPE